MNISLRTIGAFAVAVIVAIVAFNLVQVQMLSGSQLTFDVSTGWATLVNEPGQPVMTQITSRNSFSIARTDSDQTLDSTRQGSGRRVTHTFEGELPAGNMELRLARGADLNFRLTAAESITANVTPRSDRDTLIIIAVAALLILGALYYVSSSTEHAWYRRLRAPKTQASQGRESSVRAME